MSNDTKSSSGMSSPATNFSWIRLVQESELPSSSKLVLFNLVAYTNPRLDPVFPSYAKQAKDTGLSKKTVIRHLHDLDGKWVFLEERTRKNGSRSTNLIHFLIPVETAKTPGRGDMVPLPGDMVTLPEQTNEQTTLSIYTEFEKSDDPVVYLQEYWKGKIPPYYEKIIRQTVTDIALWESVIALAIEADWKLTNVKNLLREYKEQAEVDGGSKYTKNAMAGLQVEQSVLSKMRASK